MLIYPPITSHVSDPPSPNPPLGLAYIAAVLEQNGYAVKVLDAVAEGADKVKEEGELIRVGLVEDDIKKQVASFYPDVVGISAAYTAYANESHRCARIVKEVCPDAKVVFGGAHASASPDVVLCDKHVDMVVKGEGEMTFLEVVQRTEKNDEILTVPGTIVRQGINIVRNPERPLIQNLDALPPPARNLLPMDVYLQKKYFLRDFSMRPPRLSMITSRGCPFDCVFCSIHSVWGHKWRGRSPRNVVDEIELLVNSYHAREIAFLDDNISFDKKRMIAICDEIIKRKLDIKWCTPNGVYIKTLDEEVIKKMKKSGCWKLTFGIESGSLETQKFIGKVWDLKRCTKIIKLANRLGIWTHSTFIIGFPFETIDSINKTIKYAIDSDVDLANFYIATPYPGTRLRKTFEVEGLLSEDFPDHSSINLPEFNTRFFKKEDLREIQREAYSNFIRSRVFKFCNPMRLQKKVRSFEQLKFLGKMAKAAMAVQYHARMHGRVQIHKR